jgi:hypothetical protein
MSNSTRRTFLQQSAVGLATLGVSGLVLRSEGHPTQEVNRDRSNQVVIQMGPAQPEAATAKVI